MNRKALLAGGLLATILVLCVAGTKISRLTKTTSIQSTSKFYVVTQDVSGVNYSRYIESPDLARGLGPWITNQVPGGGSGDVTTAQLLVVSNQTQVASNALNASVDTKLGTNSGTGFNLKIRPVDSDDTPLEIYSIAGQDTFLFRIFDSAGDPLFSVSEEGVLGGTAGNSARLAASSTIGDVWTATDTEGRGSWQPPTGGGDVSQAQLLASSNAAVAFSMTVSNALASLELTRNAAVSNACIAFGMTVSNDVYASTTTRLLAASNACVSFTMTASNTLYSTETTRNAAVSNALVAFTMSASNTVRAASQPLDAALTSLSGQNGVTGFTVFTASETFGVRGMISSGDGISITDGDGVAGNPTFAIVTNIITSLTEDQTPATNDLVMTADTSAAGKKKVALANLPLSAPAVTALAGKVDATSGTALTLTMNGVTTVNSNLVFTPRPFVLGNTNWFADGARGMIFTNSHTALGVTNFVATNIASGQTMTWEIFVGIGSTATLPQFVAADYTSGRIEGLASNCVNIVTIRRTPMGTNVSVRAKEFLFTASKRIGLFTNLVTMTITAMATNDASTVAGVGGANTNFTLQAMGPAFVYTDAGTTNQNVVAIMGAGTGHDNFVNIATNRTATPRTYSFSAVTNNLIAVGSLTFPLQVTNALYVAYTSRGTNVYYAARYIALPAP